MERFDLIVIGAGPGGYPAAAAAAAAGLKTALIEERKVGGTCLNRGCIPTKTLLHSAELMHEFRVQKERGVLSGDILCDARDLFAYKDRVVDELRTHTERALNQKGLFRIEAHAKIAAPGRVEVGPPESGTPVTETLEAERILIAAGSEPARIPVPGAELPGVISSDTLLEENAPVPESLVIVGGGVIGVELASVYSELGCKVTILEMMPQLLPNLDKELAKNLAQILKKRGVDVFTGAALQRIEETAEGLSCIFTLKGKEQAVTASRVLMATGRRPHLAGLFDEGLGLAVDRGIVVDEHFETSVPGIFAIGDVIRGSSQLAHAATAQGEAAVAYMLGKEPAQDLSLIPACIYTSPEIAVVGLTEDEAKTRGFAAKSRKAVMHGNAKTLITGQDRSFMKVVYEEETHRVLGAQLMCARASDMIDEFSLAVQKGLTLEEMGRVVRPHPTFCEAAGDLFR